MSAFSGIVDRIVKTNSDQRHSLAIVSKFWILYESGVRLTVGADVVRKCNILAYSLKRGGGKCVCII